AGILVEARAQDAVPARSPRGLFRRELCLSRERPRHIQISERRPVELDRPIYQREIGSDRGLGADDNDRRRAPQGQGGWGEISRPDWLGPALRGLDGHTEFTFRLDRDRGGARGLLEDERDFSGGRRPFDLGPRSPQSGKCGALVEALRSSNGPNPEEM